MKLDLRDGDSLEIQPHLGPHSLILTARENKVQVDLVIRPADAAAIVGVLDAWIEERMKDGLF